MSITVSRSLGALQAPATDAPTRPRREGQNYANIGSVQTARASSSLLTGLVSAWSLDEASGTRYDSHGTHHLTESGGSTANRAAIVGSGADFTGSNRLINSDAAFYVTSASVYTVAFWAKFDTLGTMTLAIHGNNFFGDWSITYNGIENKIGLFGDGGTGSYSATPISTGVPYHFLFTHYANGTGILWINDTDATQGTLSSNAGASGTLYLNGGGFDGYLDQVYYWNRELTTAERSAVYNCGAGISYADVVGTTPLLAGMAGFWELGEGSGASRADSFGTSTLTDVNTVTQVTGVAGGKGAHFNLAAGQELYAADNAALSMGDIDFSIAAWVKLDSLPGGGSDMCIVSKGDGSSLEYELGYTGPSARFRFQVSSGSAFANNTTVLANSLGAPSTGRWYHIVGWHDSTSDTINIQVDNGTVDSVAYTHGSYDSAAQFTIGGYNGFGGIYFDGSIDQVGLWKRVLVPADRTFLYNSGAGRPFSSFSSSSTAPFLSDSFADAPTTTLASHTGATGATWTKHPSFAGTAVISVNDRLRNSSGTAIYYASGQPATANYYVEAIIRSFSAAGWCGVVGRADTSANTFYWAFTDGTTWYLYKNVTGSSFLLGSYAQTLGLGVDYALRLTMAGSALTVSVDGTSVISVTDSAITAAGRPGVVFDSAGSDSTGAHIDSIVAVDAAAGSNDTSLAAAVTTAFTSSAALSTAIALYGSAAASMTQSSVLSTAIKLLGSANTTFTTSAALQTAIALAAASNVSFAALGGFAGDTSLLGAGSIAILGTGNLNTAIALLASGNVSIVSAASLQTAIALAAASSVNFTTSSSPLTTAIAMAASASTSIVGAASLQTAIAMAGGSSVSLTTNQGLLTTGIGLAGVAAAAMSGLGNLQTAITMAGGASIVVTGTGQMSGQAAILVSTATLMSLMGTGDLATAIALSGLSTAAFTAAAGLSTAITMRGAANVSAITHADLFTQILLSGNAQFSAATVGALLTQISLAGSADAILQASANLATQITMSGHADVFLRGLGQMYEVNGAVGPVARVGLIVRGFIKGAIKAKVPGGIITSHGRKIL
jgi:hypothetical protein